MGAGLTNTIGFLVKIPGSDHIRACQRSEGQDPNQMSILMRYKEEESLLKLLNILWTCQGNHRWVHKKVQSQAITLCQEISNRQESFKMYGQGGSGQTAQRSTILLRKWFLMYFPPLICELFFFNCSCISIEPQHAWKKDLLSQVTNVTTAMPNLCPLLNNFTNMLFVLSKGLNPTAIIHQC